MWIALLLLVQEPLERYRALEFPPKPENFERGWKERVTAEFDVVRDAKLDALRAGLKDPDPYVRAISARALGIRGDKPSADALAALATSDPEGAVRIRALESLGYLKLKPEVLAAAARKEPHLGVRWAARRSEAQLESDVDHAAELREAYAAGLPEMDRAHVGRPAPDFTARTSEGKPFRLSDVLGRKPLAIYFAAYDG